MVQAGLSSTSGLVPSPRPSQGVCTHAAGRERLWLVPLAALQEKMGRRRASGAGCCQPRGSHTNQLPPHHVFLRKIPCDLPPFLPQRLHPSQPSQPVGLEKLAVGRPALSALGRAGTGHRLGFSSEHLLQKAQSDQQGRGFEKKGKLRHRGLKHRRAPCPSCGAVSCPANVSGGRCEQGWGPWL